MYIWLSNENEAPVEVYFDDFKVTQTKSSVIESQDYYPFGLTFNQYQRENSLDNKYLYNQGTGEKSFRTERIYDLALNVDQSKLRTYDYITGRWWQVDPLSEVGQESWSVYQYSYNNPVRFSDPNGDCPVCVIPLIWGLTVGEVATGAAVAAGGATAIVLAKEYGSKVLDAMGNTSPYSTPGVDFAQSMGGTKSLNSESKAKGSKNEKTNEAAKTGQEAHRQEQKKLKEQGADTEVPMELKDGTKVRKDAVRPDGTAVIIKPDTPSGRKSAAKREKLMEKNDIKTEKILYDPKDPKYQPGSPTYIGPKN